MKRILFFLLALSGLAACEETSEPSSTVSESQVNSPNGQISITFQLSDTGVPSYSVAHKGNAVINPSTLGFEFENGEALGKGFKVVDTQSSSQDENWEMPWGEQRVVRNHYKELLVQLQEVEGAKRKVNIRFKAYDDGIGFRYEFPEQDGWTEALIKEENTAFQLTGDHDCWWIPGDWDIYEHLYNETKISGIDALSKQDHPNLAQTYIPANAVNTPITMKTEAGLYLSFHEANLTDYAGMTLLVDTDKLSFKSGLVGSQNTSYKVQRNLPFNTPWRTIQIAERAGDLIESKLIVNLNEPNQLGDVSWFTPTKYVGIWWEMHLAKSTWKLEGGKHGATTAHAKELIDFAAKNSIGGILVEGWNTGWERWIGFEDREGVFDFVTPYPDYDLKEVVRYGREKGVELIMHHETSAAVRTYEQQLDTAYALMQSLGIHSVKTGYVGKIIPKGEHHHGQYMVRHYRKVLETAAKYQIAINAHEPIKATGIRRTLPNAISREGLRGMEFNAFSDEGTNGPDHLPIVAFTRMLAGPIDFTPGVFKTDLKPYKEKNHVSTTIAGQLALYVVIYSPIQMVADLLENFEGYEEEMRFIQDVGVDWEQSKVINGEIGDFVTIARQERGTENWFIGSITDEEPRTFDITLDFLDEGTTYEARIYQDGEGAHYLDNPTIVDIETRKMKKGDVITVRLAPSGGLAVSLMPVNE